MLEGVCVYVNMVQGEVRELEAECDIQCVKSIPVTCRGLEGQISEAHHGEV